MILPKYINWNVKCRLPNPHTKKQSILETAGPIYGLDFIDPKSYFPYSAEEISLHDDLLLERLPRALATLTKREQECLILRYGLHGKGEHTYEQIADIVKPTVTSERVRGIINTALRRLHHLRRWCSPNDFAFTVLWTREIQKILYRPRYLKPIRQKETGLPIGYAFWCPGCEREHIFWTAASVPNWRFNNSLDYPTFEPGLATREWVSSAGSYQLQCELHVTDGQIIFCHSCGHGLKGKIVNMVDLNIQRGNEVTRA